MNAENTEKKGNEIIKIINGIEYDTSKRELPPPRTEINGNEKIETSYYYNEKGQLYRRNKYYLIVKKKIRVSKNILRRMKIKKFGRAVNDTDMDSTIIIEEPQELILADHKYLETKENKTSQKKNKDSPIINNITNNITHNFSDKYIPAHKKEQINTGQNNSNESPKSNKYVVPSKRYNNNYEKYEVDPSQITTLCVSNIPMYIEEDYLTELFSYYGYIKRVHIAKCRKTGKSRGIAFITFRDRFEAENAMQEMDKYIIDNLVISIDWSKY